MSSQSEGRGGSYTIFTNQLSNSDDLLVKSFVLSFSQIFVQSEMK